jgi:predicted outer membrane repeat protein
MSFPTRPRRPASLAFATLLLAACGTSAPGGDDDDGGGDDDGVMPDAGTIVVEPDSMTPCMPTGDEVYGDEVDNDCDGIIDELRVCGDGSEPFTTLTEAIAAAPDGGGVEVCAGVYNERLDITKNLRINGAGADATILDAGNAGRAILVRSGVQFQIAGFTVRNGRADNEGAGIRCDAAALGIYDSKIVGHRSELGGGGVYVGGCQINFARTAFDSNEGSGRGGAIYAINTNGVIVDSTFAANGADEGAAVLLDGGDVNITTSTFTGNNARVRGGALWQGSDGDVVGSTFTANHSGWTGGAVYVWKHAPTFQGNTFDNNHCEWEGGGFYLHQSTAHLIENSITNNTSFDDGAGLRVFESAITAERNTISHNHAIDGDGGAFKSSHVAGLYIDNVITDNQALGAGGGIELDNDSSVVRGGLIARNKSSIGGGVHIMLWPWNGGLIENVRIEDNDAWRGGGFYIENNFQPVTIRRVTIKGNHAHQGGAVYTRGTPLRLSNSVLVGNTTGDVGGAFYVDPSASYPWTKECPCPPIDPQAEASFLVVHGNGSTTDPGAAAWIGAPNFTIHDSILTGHTTTAVVVDPLTAGTPGWRYNDTYPATFQGMADPTGSNGNLSTDPLFMGAEDWHLNTGSACRDAGTPAMTDHDGTRADLGLYGGPDAP